MPGTDNHLIEAGMRAAIAGFGMVNVSTGAKSDILQKAEVKVRTGLARAATFSLAVTKIRNMSA